MDIEIDVCVACGCSMSRGHFETCPSCNSEHMVSQEKFEEAKRGNVDNEYHFPNNSPSKYTPELQQKIYDEHKAERERTAREKQLAEHPRTADGELDMSSELNNPLVPNSPIKPTADESEEPDMSQPENNPYIPGSSAPENFGKEEEEVDMTLPENNPYIPQGKEV